MDLVPPGLSFGSFIRPVVCLVHARPGQVRSSGRPAFPACRLRSSPSGVFRRSQRFPRRRRLPARVRGASSLGFFQAKVSGFPVRPQGRPRGRSSLMDICKTPDRRSRWRSLGRHPLSGSGKVPGASSRFCRAAVRPATRTLALSDFKAFSRLGHACQDCRHSARWVGPLRPAPGPSAHCPPPFPKGTGVRQREHRRRCSRVRVVHQRRFPFRSSCLISGDPFGWNPAASRAVSAPLPSRGRHPPLRRAAPSLSLGSPGVRFLAVPVVPRSEQVGGIHGWLLLAAKNLAPARSSVRGILMSRRPARPGSPVARRHVIGIVPGIRHSSTLLVRTIRQAFRFAGFP